MNLQENFSLKAYNSFGIDVSAAFFAELNSVADIEICIQKGFFEGNYLLLGGGTNILFTKNFDGVVFHNNLKGISLLEENANHVLLRAAGGELWHNLVLYAVENNWGGIENLSLIPGTVGASPIQNIGAYGVELKDSFYSLEAMHLVSGKMETFYFEDCAFDYRNSVFKNKLKGKYIITSVTLRLKKQAQINSTYGAIQDILNAENISHPTIKDISNAVIKIRKSKLPDPHILGNAGSFFKNPEIPTDQFEILKNTFPKIPGYPTSDNLTKVPAGWLIEQCGWKGKRVGNTGAHKDQALVLVNYGGATGNAIYALAMDIKTSVKNTFGIDIQPEVNIV